MRSSNLIAFIVLAAGIQAKNSYRRDLDFCEFVGQTCGDSETNCCLSRNGFVFCGDDVTRFQACNANEHCVDEFGAGSVCKTNEILVSDANKA